MKKMPLNNNEPYFVADRDVGQIKTQLVRNAPVKITRAATGSRGQDTTVEFIEPTRDVYDWAPDDNDIPNDGKLSGFGAYKDRFGEQQEEDSLYPIDYMTKEALSPAEERRILLSKDAASERLARIHRDPVTRVPENFAAVDRMPESDSFYGNDKTEAETTTTMNRAKDVDRGMERVDYKKSKSVPIKMIGK